MSKLILHIGRHKTGTTAIQRFLYRNRDLLHDSDWYYPRSGIRSFGHHELGAALTRSALAKTSDGGKAAIRRMRDMLQAELGDDHGRIVISSESFQNCKPEVVRELLVDRDVEVVVYIREQVAYLLSAYAQKVQASTYTGDLATFHRETSHHTYLEFLSEWESVFAHRLHVRNYDRRELVAGSVVVDFCRDFLSLDEQIIVQRSQHDDANPTLTRDLLDYKLFVNRHVTLTSEHSRWLFNTLARLSASDGSGALTIDSGLAGEVVERYAESNRQVAQRYLDRDVLFRPFNSDRIGPSSTGPDPQRLLDVHQRVIAATPALAGCLERAPWPVPRRQSA